MKARAVFDTLTYANRLKAAGLNDKIAETQAEANADMVANLLDSGLVSQESFQLGLTRLETKIHSAEARLDARIQDLETRLDARIQDLETRLDARIQDLETRLEAKIQDLEIRIDSKIQLVRSDLAQQMIQIESHLRQEIKDLETRLTIRLGGIMAGSIAITATLLSLLHIIH